MAAPYLVNQKYTDPQTTASRARRKPEGCAAESVRFILSQDSFRLPPVTYRLALQMRYNLRRPIHPSSGKNEFGTTDNH